MTDQPTEVFALTSSRHFPSWLAATGGGLAFSTYQAGKLFFLGSKPDGKLSVFERTFARCMGVGVSAQPIIAVNQPRPQIIGIKPFYTSFFPHLTVDECAQSLRSVGLIVGLVVDEQTNCGESEIVKECRPPF